MLKFKFNINDFLPMLSFRRSPSFAIVSSSLTKLTAADIFGIVLEKFSR